METMMNDIESKMFYCKKFDVKILPSSCKYRKELGSKHKTLTKNQKYDKYQMIKEIVKYCLPCEEIDGKLI
jgi:hypothetical protein